MTGLIVENVHKRFGSYHAVRGLDFTLESGEIVALLGPSGCGKTTALRMIAGLESPDSGTISIAGQIVRSDTVDQPPENRRIGMVFQSYAVWPHRNIRDNVAYPLTLQKAKDAKERAEQAMATVHLKGMGDRFPGTLSGGQQQRVALARALVAEPALLLFDEPLSNLDAKLREDMRHEIRQIAKSLGITSLYVTHDQPEAFAVSDRVAVVLDGKVAQIDPPKQLYTAPNSLPVARFVGRLSELTQFERTSETQVQLGNLPVDITVAEGDGTRLGVRPEAIDLVDKNAPHISAEVVRATFLGEKTEVDLTTPHGPLRADLAPHTDCAPGDTLTLAIRSARLY